MAFTLVELLVAMAVLTLLLILVSQIAGSAARTTTAGRSRLDADAQARIALDRIGADLIGMLKRKDVDYLFEKAVGNDRLFFLSEAPGFYAATPGQIPSGVSLVGYRINTQHALERLGKELSFTSIPFKTPEVGAAANLDVVWSVALDPTKNDPEDSATDPDWGLLAEDIFRLEFQFIQKSTGQLISPTGVQRDLTDIAAVVITLGILDAASREIVGDLSPVAAALPDSGTTSLTKTWEDLVNTPAFATGLPRAAASQVRVYQRTYAITQP